MPPWEVFFRCQRSPMLRSQLLTALMAGTQLEAERIHHAALLDAVLLCTAAREHCEAEIVDDYEALLRRTADKWGQPDWTTKVFDSIHASTASFIILRRLKNLQDGFAVAELDVPEVCYIPDLVRWYLGHDVPDYFRVVSSTKKKRAKK